MLLSVGTVFHAYSPPAGPYADVPAGHWAASAIKATSVDREWMTASDGRFRPAELLTRAELAAAAVKAFAPKVATFPKITFKDLSTNDPAFAHANVATGLGWLGTTKDREFLPAKPPSKADVATVFAKALGLKAELSGLDNISTKTGEPLKHPRWFGAMAISGALRLFYNHTDDAREILPHQPVTRADAAYALRQASAAAGTWRINALRRFRSITIAQTSPQRRDMIEFAFSYIGYPYFPAGDWHGPTPSGYCCGAQKQGGFDCSGFVWWVVKEPGGGYDNTSIRRYKGWPLPERSSREMARAATPRLTMQQTLPGDLVFSDIDGKGNDYQAIDHVGIALGNGWMIHASGPGVLLEWVGDGWWPKRLRWGRRMGPEPVPAPPPSKPSSPSPSASPSARR